MADSDIREIDISKDSDGKYKKVRVIFGPHYFLEIEKTGKDGLSFVLGATHHGFKVDATQVGGGLEKIIDEIRNFYPKNCVD